MKKFIKILLISLLILFDTSTPKLSATENTSKQTLTSMKLTELHSISTKSGKKINFLTNGGDLYITAYSSSSININKLKLVILSSTSSKTLVNSSHAITKGFVPLNLIKINSSKIKLEYSDLKLIPQTVNALYSMIASANKNNVKQFIVNSAYRNEDTQREIFNANLKIFKNTSKTYEEAFEKTRKLVALPGNSEHQTGLALDIFSINGRHRNDFEGTKEQLWLKRNSHKYGFIIRYPKDKTEETSSIYEPWHIRYVGISLSSYLDDKKLCLEEFYDNIFEGNILENTNYVFMKINDKEKVYIDQNIVSQAELETVTNGTLLLTFKK